MIASYFCWAGLARQEVIRTIISKGPHNKKATMTKPKEDFLVLL
jgi:hypothetical protein